MPINCSLLWGERVVFDGHGGHTALYFGVEAKENQDKVPKLYWLLKDDFRLPWQIIYKVPISKIRTHPVESLSLFLSPFYTLIYMY